MNILFEAGQNYCRFLSLSLKCERCFSNFFFSLWTISGSEVTFTILRLKSGTYRYNVLYQPFTEQNDILIRYF
jgi:hypothetical protein